MKILGKAIRSILAINQPIVKSALLKIRSGYSYVANYMKIMENSINGILQSMGGNIRAVRLMRNYSQDYLAIRLKISQNAYSKIELGRTMITVDRLLRIACVLDVGFVELLELPNQWQIRN